MLRFSSGELLVQIVAGAAAWVYTAPAQIEIGLVLGSGSFILYHDATGAASIGAANQLTPSISQFQAQGAGSGIMLRPGDRLGVSGTGTVSVYGISASQIN